MSGGDLRRWKKRVGGLAAFAALAFGTSALFAQDVPPSTGALDLLTFRPLVGPAVFGTEAADTLGHLEPGAALVVDFVSKPLVLGFDDGTTGDVINQRVALHVMGGVGLFDIAQIDLALPIYMVNDGAYQGRDIRDATAGDLAIRTRFNLLSSQEGPIGLGASLAMSLPTGKEEDFAGSGGVTLAPMLITDTRFATPLGKGLVALNVGARLRATEEIHDLEVGSELLYRLGAELEVVDNVLAIGAELFGSTQLSDFFDSATSPLEAIVGARVLTGAGFSIIGGGGGGLIGGVGSPEFRAFIGLTYAYAEASEPEAIEETKYPEEFEDLDEESQLMP